MTTEAEIRRIFPFMAQSQIDAIMQLSDAPATPDKRNPLGQSDRDIALAGLHKAQMTNRDSAAAAFQERWQKPACEEPLMQFFAQWSATSYPDTTVGQMEAIKIMGSEFYRMARSITAELPRNPERTVALRKLLEARDCAMRAAVMK